MKKEREDAMRLADIELSQAVGLKPNTSGLCPGCQEAMLQEQGAEWRDIPMPDGRRVQVRTLTERYCKRCGWRAYVKVG